jgi:hypothetical protein
MLAKIAKSLKSGGDVGGAPAVIIIVLVVALIAAVYWWRDYSASNAKSPNFATPGQALPGGLTLPGKMPANSGFKSSNP